MRTRSIARLLHGLAFGLVGSAGIVFALDTIPTVPPAHTAPVHTAPAQAAPMLAAPAPAAPVASCAPLDPADQEAQADAIVAADVLDVALGPTASRVRIGVRHVVKGTPPAELVLEASLPGEGIAGEVPFGDGWPHWLLYLRETTPGSGQWYTSLCDGSRPIPAP